MADINTEPFTRNQPYAIQRDRRTVLEAIDSRLDALEQSAFGGGLATLDDIGDVASYSGLASGHLPIWNGTAWANALLGSTSIASGVVQNSHLADMNAWSIKVRNAGTSGVSQNAILGSFTQDTDPSAGEFLFGFRADGSFMVVDIADLPIESGGVGGVPVADTKALVKGSVDDTKKWRVEVDGFTTSTTRVLTPADRDWAPTTYGEELTEVADASAGRTKLDAASSAQGALADSAIQPGDQITVLDATAHRLFISDASGDVTEIAFGTSGQVLKSAGASSAPSFQDETSGLPIADDNTLVKGSIDDTKQWRIEIDGFTTATTRVLTPPNRHWTPTVYGAELTEVSDAAAGRTKLGVVIGTDVQAQDADLQALADEAGTGLYTRTGAGTGATRSLAAGSNKLSVTNGDGVSGNPTADVVPSNIDISTLQNAGALAAKAAVAEAAVALPTTGTVTLDFSQPVTLMYPTISQTGAIDFAVGANPVDGAEVRLVVITDGSGVTFPTGAGNFEPEGWPGGDFSTHNYTSGQHNLRIWWSVAQNRAIVDSNPKHGAEIRNDAITTGKIAALAVTPAKASFLGRAGLGDDATCATALFAGHNVAAANPPTVDSWDHASRYRTSRQLNDNVNGDTVKLNADGSVKTKSDATAGTQAALVDNATILDQDQVLVALQLVLRRVNGNFDLNNVYRARDTTGFVLRHDFLIVYTDAGTEFASITALPFDVRVNVAFSINRTNGNWKIAQRSSVQSKDENGTFTENILDWKSQAVWELLGEWSSAVDGEIDWYGALVETVPGTTDLTFEDLYRAMDEVADRANAAPGRAYLDALALDVLADVSVSAPEEDDVLSYDGFLFRSRSRTEAGIQARITPEALQTASTPYSLTSDRRLGLGKNIFAGANDVKFELPQAANEGHTFVCYAMSKDGTARTGCGVTINGGVGTLPIAGEVPISAGGVAYITVRRNPGSAPEVLVDGDVPLPVEGLLLQDYSEVRAAQSGVTGGITIDFAEAPYHEITHGAGNITGVTIDNWPASGELGALTVDYIQDGTGGRTVTHPTGTSWFGGAPTFDTAGGKRNRVTYTTDDGGTTVLAHYAGAI